ncbi:Gfo/Idh/MocA family protein [Ilumatobacter sp.]|uniref:Gfo/Idh/MocA family protein n=1 Tax=Ilumatobacter sp. TaxID=1967498 RepID=UPI003B52401E
MTADVGRSADDPVGIGVVGVGSFVANAAVLPAVEAATGCRLVALASRGSRIDPRWESVAVADYDDVVGHPDVEAVYIPLPNGMHREWTERCAAAGKHVLCEKPLAADAETARAMVDACDRAGVILAEAWMTPFHDRYREVVERARSGDVGDVTAIHGSFRFTIGPDADDNYRWDADQGGGALLDVGIYALGAIVELWDHEPETVEVRTRRRGGVDASTEASLRWPDGREGTISCSFVDDEVQRLTVCGTGGTLAIPTEAFTGGVGDTTYLRSAHVASERPDAGRAGDAAPGSPVTVAGNDPYRSMVEAFAIAVRGTRPWPRPAERSVEMLELLDRIRSVAS